MLRTCAGQVRRHRVHALGQVLPDAADLAHLGLPAELALGADLARHARDLGREHAELLDHGVDDRRRAQELARERPAVDVELDRLQQVPLRDGRDRAGHLGDRADQVVDQRVVRDLHLAPRAARARDPGALADLAFLADDLADASHLAGHVLVQRDDLVEAIGDLAFQAGPVGRKSYGEVAVAHRLEPLQQHAQVGGWVGGHAVAFAARGGADGWRHQRSPIRGGTRIGERRPSWDWDGLVRMRSGMGAGIGAQNCQAPEISARNFYKPLDPPLRHPAPRSFKRSGQSAARSGPGAEGGAASEASR